MFKGIDKEALKVFENKKNLILIDISKFKNEIGQQIKYFGNSFLVQDKNSKVMDTKKLNLLQSLKPNKMS